MAIDDTAIKQLLERASVETTRIAERNGCTSARAVMYGFSSALGT